ncbi:tail fiber protein [Cupriavidus necator]|uniref:phage tail protein n=1 Tax=Cupriavidus necator TaxID=106590 RepID=UPI00339D36C4
MSDQYLGEIRVFACNYPPRDWAACDGQLLPIAQNQALFSLLGTQYGGNGTTTFALPDLRGRAVTGPVNGVLNDPVGTATVTLTAAGMPAHHHTVYGDTARAVSTEASARLPARFMLPNNQSYLPTNASPAPVMTTLSPLAVAPAGESQPHQNMQPYTALMFCIALAGEFPPRP